MNYDKLRECELFLLDMDGTLYLGDEVFGGAVDFIAALAETHRRYIYLTNNSSRAGEDYITRLRTLGFPCGRENVFTSGMATGEYLRTRHPGERVYCLGTPAFERELMSYGVTLTQGDDADVVCAGFDTTLTYEKLDRAVHFLRPRGRLRRREPGLGLPHARRGGHAGLRQHLRPAHRRERREALLHRQAEPGYGRHNLRDDRRAQREDMLRGRPAVHGHSRRGG